MKVFKQLSLLIWKNYILQIRRPVATLFRLGLPVLFIFIILLIRVLRIKQEHIGATVWKDFSIERIPYKHPGQGIWKIAYTPNNAEIRSVMEEAVDTLGLNASSISGYRTEEAMVREIINDQEKPADKWNYLCGVVFKGNLNETHVTYKVRFPSSLRNSQSNKTNKFSGFQVGQGTWQTKSVFPRTFDGIGPRSNKSKSGGPPDYFKEGFLSVQLAIDSALISFKGSQINGSANLNISQIKMQRFPYPAYIKDPFVVVIQISLPLLLMLSLVYNALLVVKEVVYEKEKRLKESMKIMGLTGYLHWVAWFIKCFVLLLIPMALVTIMLTVKFGNNGKMLQKSDPSLIFVYLVLYSISSIMYGFMISTFFSKANTAAAGGGITWFLSYIPYFFLSMYYDLLNTPQKTISCIDFNVGMAFGAALIGKFEGQGIGVQWSNLFQGVTVDDSFSFGAVLFMMMFDSVLYGLIMWYIEAVFPGEYGIPQPWYFPFKRSYWCGGKVEASQNDDYVQFQNENRDNEDDKPPANESFIEKEPANLKAGIQIQNLRKQFATDTGVKVAVNGLTLNMYEGHITALLGHNGAGKTTTISMVTGLFPPTSGTAVVNGYDITENITGVRESLGICPQHNVLYDNLTVAEHLWFFAKLKGINDKKLLEDEVNRLIDAVGLEDKRDVQTKKLSGGMKRKLSVGIALIGNSKIVILDEPTSGMDPAARRFTWDLLQKERKERTILLTTHFMDEADLLGDRIAIMANGVLQCCGTSLFLKNKYGVGYHMVMVKSAECDVAKVSSVIKRFIPSAKLENDVGLELSYILPSEESKNFETLFSYLEENKNELGISSYGASVTTLEEVFLRVKEEESLQEDSESLSKKLYRQLSSKSNSTSKRSNGDRSGFEIDSSRSAPSQSTHSESGDYFGSSQRIMGQKLFYQKWRAMFVKRFLNSKRYKRSIITQLLMPGFWTLMAMIVAKTFPQPTDSPPLTLDSKMFKENYVYYSDPESTTNPSSKGFFQVFVDQFRSTQTKPINVTTPSHGNLTSYILKKSAVDIGEFNLKYLIAVNAKESSNIFAVKAWFNNAAYHSSAAILNAVNNARFRYVTGTSGSITTINHPLPRTTSQSIDDLSRNGVGFNVSFNILFGMAFLASSFVVFLVQERASKAKHLQFVSGVGPFCYWTASLAWDLINFLIPIILIVIIFAAFDVPAYSGNRLGYVVVLLLLYGWAIIPLVYLSSFLFTVPSTAFIRLTIFNVITGLATLLTIFILSQPQLDLLDVASGLKWVFLFLPNYALGQALNDLFVNHQYIELFNKGFEMCMKTKLPFPVPQDKKEEICRKFVLNVLKNSPSKMVFQDNYLSWELPGIGRPLVFMACEGLVFFLLVLFVEYGGFKLLIKSLRSSSRKVFEMMENGMSVAADDDVAAEMRKIQRNDTANDVLVLENVTKYYGSVGKRFLAVDGLFLGMPRGECFGLLGLNGAGKTTTFKMITGDERVSDGCIYVDGYDIEQNMTKVRQCIGYCPQFDALIDLLTGRELLTMYARLRGIPESRIPKIVEDLALSLSFEQHIDKISKTYSGGNKRKLSTALALVGNPQVVFLDEPTSGMDPAARRKLWNALTRFRDQKGSIVITSHSMEECEALCTRLAIMVNGQFKCLGSPQHLKSKFGEGYTLLARVGGINPDTTPLKQLISQNFPGSILKDEHQGFINYQLKDATNSWARVFGVLEKNKERYNIEDYSVSQTTLEQVFLNFARYQREDERQTLNA